MRRYDVRCHRDAIISIVHIVTVWARDVEHAYSQCRAAGYVPLAVEPRRGR